MSYAIWLAPVGLAMGLVGLVAFLWSMKSGQLEDLDGAAERVLLTEEDRPLAPERINHQDGAAGTDDVHPPLPDDRGDPHRDAHR